MPDVLISTDTPISERIQSEGYSQKNTHYTRKPLPDSGSRRIAQKYFGYSSGPVAVGQAAIDGATAIYLVGFDLGPTTDGKFNNVYAGTEFYKQVGASPTFTGNWVKQLTKVISDNPHQTFTRVIGNTTSDQPDLNKLINYKTLCLKDFLNLINNTKDL